MVTKSRLKMALAAEKGVDFKKQHQKKLAKDAAKRKAAEAEEVDEEENDEDEDEDVDDSEGSEEVEDFGV